MPRPRNTIYAPVIASLRADLMRFERQVADTRALLQGLCAHAGIAGEQATAPGEAAMAPKAKGTRGQLRGPKKGSGRGKGKGKGTSVGGSLLEPPTKDVATLAELGVSKRLVAEATAQAESAVQAKDAEKLGAAIAARARAERRAGELLIGLSGRVKLPNISKAERKRYRAKAELLEDEFEAAIRQLRRKAVAAISSRIVARPTMKLTPWRKDADGSLSRTLTAVDGEAATP